MQFVTVVLVEYYSENKLFCFAGDPKPLCKSFSSLSLPIGWMTQVSWQVDENL